MAHVPLEAASALLTSMKLPFASLSELLNKCPAFQPDGISDVQQSMGISENLSTMDSNAALDNPISDVTLLLVIFQHTVGTLLFFLAYLKHRVTQDRTASQAQRELERFFATYLQDLSDTVAANPSHLGTFFAGLLRGFNRVEDAAADLAKRLLTWQYPGHDSDVSGPQIPADLAVYPTGIALLATPQLSLAADLIGGMTSQLIFSLFQSLTATPDRFTQDATVLARRAIDAQSNCDPHADLHARMRAFSSTQSQAMPATDGYDGHFNVWRIRSRAATITLAARVALRFLTTAVLGAYNLQADAHPPGGCRRMRVLNLTTSSPIPRLCGLTSWSTAPLVTFLPNRQVLFPPPARPSFPAQQV